MKLSELEPAADFWARPAPAARGDDDPRQIHEAVGFALSTWGMLENNFSFLFALFVDSGSHAARRAYGALSGNSARAEALRAAAEVFHTEWFVERDDREQFERLMEHFTRAWGRRNEIAHGMVMSVLDVGHFLVPPDYNSSRVAAFLDDREYRRDQLLRLKTQYRYRRDDILEISRRFGVLADATIGYVFDLKKQYVKDAGPVG